MRIEIFNVGHGSAALVIADNENIVLLDCGHDDAGFRPSRYIPSRWKRIQQFIVSHFDSDHVSDLANLAASMPIEMLVSNTSIPAASIRRLKEQEGPLTPGMRTLLNMRSTFGPPGCGVSPDLGGIRVQTFYHRYPTFADMNNLSIVTFVEYDGFCIVFPGDMERKGWLAHLRSPLFCEYLSRVNIFVASHHGRDNGYCQEVFDFCHPELVVISDTDIRHETQNHCYADHSGGIQFFRGGADLGMRYVLTTRCDGHITLEKARSQPFRVRYN